MPAKRDEEYWDEKFRALEGQTHKKSEGYVSKLKGIFSNCAANLNEHLNWLYSKFADLENITISEAKKILSKDELRAFRISIKEYIQYSKANAEYMDENWAKMLEEASTKYRVNRLEATYYQMCGEIAKLLGSEQEILYKAISEAYIDRYYHSAFEIFKGFGVGTSFDMVNMNELEGILNDPWAVDGINYSKRVANKLKKNLNTISQLISSACISGEGYETTAKKLTEEINISFRDAKTIVQTESAYFSSKAQRTCFSNLGVKKYKIVVTLDNITDPECQDLDGKIYKEDEYQIGYTAPPFHPNCRCSTAPYFGNSGIKGLTEGTRTARNKMGEKTYRVPQNMTYEQWRKKYNIEPIYGTTEDQLAQYDTLPIINVSEE